MRYLSEEKKAELIQQAAERGVDASAIRFRGEHVFYVRRGGELIFERAMTADELRRFLEGLRR